MNLLEVCAEYEKYAVYDETHAWGGVEGYFKKRAQEILSVLSGDVIRQDNKLPLLESALMHAFKLGQSKGLDKQASTTPALHPYKFRAECRPDVDRLHKVLSRAGIKIEQWNITQQYPYPDVEVSFKTDVPLQTIQHAMRVVPDSHVMIETIQPIDSYSGERKYERRAPKLNSKRQSLSKTAGVTIQFRPQEVDGFVALCIEMNGGKYEYNAKGSKVSFTGNTFHNFLSDLQRAMNDEYTEDDEKVSIQHTLDHIMRQLPSA